MPPLLRLTGRAVLNVRAVTSYGEFLKLEPVWNKLLAESDSDILFMTFEWFNHWWLMFGNDVEMLTLVVTNADKDIIAIAPLIQKKVRHRGLPLKVVSFMANYYSPRVGMIIADGGYMVVEAVFEFLKRNRYRYDMLYLDMIEKGSMVDRQIKEGLSGGFVRHREMEGEHSPYLNVDGTWDDYLKGKSKNFRRHMKRNADDFSADKGYAIVKYGCSDAKIATQDIISISKRTWKNENGSGITGSPQSVNYYRSFIQMLADNGWLQVNVLKHGDVPVAFAFNAKYKSIMYGLQTGYDSGYKALSPGRFIMTYTIMCAFGADVKEFDLLGKDEPYKLEFTSTRRGHSKYFIFNDTLLGGVMHAMENMIVPKAKAITSWAGAYGEGR
jgi:CelD/BcsL family acetyltransferase involved in cellulose biosynthesis